MKEICLDIGIVQAFLDSELTLGETDRVSAHIAVCDVCALMLAVAEEETAIAFPALERELNTLVPTQRLWAKINNSIQTEHNTYWHKAWAFMSVALANPSITAAASLLIVAGIFAAVMMNDTNAPTVGAPSQTVAKAPSSPTNFTAPAVQVNSTEVRQAAPAFQPAIKAERAVYRPESRRAVTTPEVNNAVLTSTGYLPGEESYVKTISNLNRTVDEQKDGLMAPSERIAYERDMAVVNDTISKMKSEVKRNPRNEAARQVLYSSYQNKIDLLNSVAQKEELVASLK